MIVCSIFNVSRLLRLNLLSDFRLFSSTKCGYNKYDMTVQIEVTLEKSSGAFQLVKMPGREIKIIIIKKRVITGQLQNYFHFTSYVGIKSSRMTL